MEKILRWWPIMGAAAAIVAAGAVGQFQLAAQASNLEAVEQDVEDNEEDIEAIQKQLIERQGTIKLDLERLRIQQNQQSEKLDSVLQLLRTRD